MIRLTVLLSLVICLGAFTTPSRVLEIPRYYVLPVASGRFLTDDAGTFFITDDAGVFYVTN